MQLTQNYFTHPFVAVTYSPRIRGRARKWSAHYEGHRVVQAGLTPDGEWSLSPNTDAVRVLYDDGGLSTGSTGKSAGYRSALHAKNLANHLNLLHSVARGTQRITLAQIAEQTNSEMQRELIERYDGSAKSIEPREAGWDTYLADVSASVLHTDDTGALIEIPTAGEPIRAVRVTCPSTGRQYALRVPPTTTTAHAGVAWTFGLTADQYQPTAQS